MDTLFPGEVPEAKGRGLHMRPDREKQHAFPSGRVGVAAPHGRLHICFAEEGDALSSQL